MTGIPPAPVLSPPPTPAGVPPQGMPPLVPASQYQTPPVDMVGGPLALVVMLILVVLGAATFLFIHMHPELAQVAFTFLGGTLLPALMGYNGYQSWRTRRTIHRVGEEINRVSAETTAKAADAVTAKVADVVKDVVKEAVVDANKELPK